MKVLKPGNTHKNIWCPKCHAYISYTANDIEVIEQFDDWCGYYYQAQRIKCPECGEKIILKEIYG